MKTKSNLFKKPLSALSLFLLFLPLLISCNKEKLTKPTQTGANTFSCKINGVLYIPRNAPFSANGIDVSLYGDNSNPNIHNLVILTSAPQFKPPRQLHINLYNISNTGIYPLRGSNFRLCQYFTLSPDEREYSTKTSDVGEITITKFDLTNKIISGTFWFNAINLKDANDKVSITDGRFDTEL